MLLKRRDQCFFGELLPPTGLGGPKGTGNNTRNLGPMGRGGEAGIGKETGFLLGLLASALQTSELTVPLPTGAPHSPRLEV